MEIYYKKKTIVEKIHDEMSKAIGMGERIETVILTAAEMNEFINLSPKPLVEKEHGKYDYRGIIVQQ